MAISLTGSLYSQNFNTLALTGTSSVLPADWVMLESGTNANAIYTAGTGSSATGDTYSFGATGSTERALGGLQSGTLIPLFGASFTNNTGATLSELLVAYTGDTSPAGLDNYPAVYDCKILITELSFIRASHRRDKIHKYGHMHHDDFIERQDRFQNELIVAGHFSTRYHPSEVKRILDNKLPANLKARMRLWI